jgi:hypothetical protein
MEHVMTQLQIPAQSFFSVPNQISILWMPSFHMPNIPEKQHPQSIAITKVEKLYLILQIHSAHKKFFT